MIWVWIGFTYKKFELSTSSSFVTMGAKSLMILVCLFLGLALGKLPEELEDLQTEFFLPYSVTEDVDFTIQRPVQWGCYQW